MLSRYVWDVLFGVFCWLIVFVGIYSKHCKVACMSWPCPIVCVASKLAYIGRWSSYQPYIIEDFADVEEVLVTIVEWFYFGLIMIVLGCFFGDFSNSLIY